MMKYGQEGDGTDEQQTDDLEQKKLVYLYLMNYAKTQPELVILAVNTFVKVRSAKIRHRDSRNSDRLSSHAGHGRPESACPSFGYPDYVGAPS